ncbi:unnamed protein product [Spodoptera exigua]|nr:unnamed protein product [Spodoptera exigua]
MHECVISEKSVCQMSFFVTCQQQSSRDLYYYLLPLLPFQLYPEPTPLFLRTFSLQLQIRPKCFCSYYLGNNLTNRLYNRCCKTLNYIPFDYFSCLRLFIE